MYNAFFNLRENPFALNPDPKFFFWDKVHSDAMKYLMFGIKNKEGFIEIMGEAGTGKTLICLTLLTQLDKNTHTVLFLNPPQDEAEFLQTVVSNLKLSPRAKSRKGMIEAIYDFATKESSQGHNIVFILDEAQHLSAELLEKIRLLTNSPQGTRPIQVILIGQPELDENLRSYELRQLYQRITIRFRLKTLSWTEMGAYIDFRLKQGRTSQTITFSRGALRIIFWFSKGNPRLVNIICEKAIMAASLDQTSRITTQLVKAAMKSSLAVDNSFSTFQSLMTYPRMVLASVIFICVLAGGFFWKFQGNTGFPLGTKHDPALVVADIISTPSAEAYKKPAEKLYAAATDTVREDSGVSESKVESKLAVVDSAVMDKMINSEIVENVTAGVIKKGGIEVSDEVVGEVTAEIDNPISDEDGIMRINKFAGNYKLASLVTLLSLWEVKGIESSQIDWWGQIEPYNFSFGDISLQYGLEASLLTTSLDELRSFNIPAILLDVYDPSLDRSCSMVLTGMDNNQIAVLHPGQGKKIFDKEDLERNWEKQAIVLWRNPDKIPSRSISPLMGEVVLDKVWHRLRIYGYASGMLPDNPSDAWVSVKRAVMDFQRKNGLKEDGIIGTRTRLKLYADYGGDTSPTLLVLSTNK